MPSLITHYLCGDKWLNQINEEAMKSLVHKYRQVFNVGTQGPDILFYYRIWPWFNSNGIDKVGSRMHGERVAAVFYEGIKYILEAKENKELLIAYFLGYATHYALDSNSHPYIYYMTGFGKEDNFKQQYSCHHSRFEKAIDLHMLKKEYKLEHTDIKAEDFIRLTPYEAKVIGEMYATVIQRIFEIQLTPKQVSTAISDMGKIYSFLEDKNGTKMRLFNWLETKLNYTSYVTSNIYPHVLNNDYDYLNRNNSSWHLPWDNSVARNESFEELFNKSVEESNILCRSILNCVTGNSSIDDTMRIIGNKSFSTGMDCDLGIEMKYHNCIYEQ